MVTHIERIIARRKYLRWSQERLARELQLVGLNISRSAIGKLEIGHRNVSPQELPYFAMALRVDPNWLLNWEEFKKR